jgi:hypothetical protein
VIVLPNSLEEIQGQPHQLRSSNFPSSPKKQHNKTGHEMISIIFIPPGTGQVGAQLKHACSLK